MAETTETLYTVARGTTALTDLRSNVRAAKTDLTAIEGSMRAAKLEPDVQLATVTRTTTLSDPTPYVEQTAAVDEPLPEQGDAEQPPTDEKQATTEKKAASK
jgi:hypothetical protein